MSENNLNQSLLQFLVNEKQPIKSGQNKLYQKYKKNQTIFYLVGLVLAQITLMISTIANFSDKAINYFILSIIIWVMIWSVCGLVKKYMLKMQFVFWVHTCFHALMFALKNIASNHHFILCGCSTGIIFFMVIQLILNKKLVSSKIYIYLYIWFALIFYQQMKKNYYTPGWLIMMLPYFYFVLGAVVFVILCRKWKQILVYGRFQFLCLGYLLSLLLVACLSGSFHQKSYIVSWSFFSLISHIVYVLICVFIYKNMSIFRIFFNKSANLQDARQILYQHSDCMLVSEDDYVENPRQSMAGNPPLASCQICYSQQSCFCYTVCKHAIVGKNCAQAWLRQPKLKKCSLCRMDSPSLLFIQRIDGIKFAVNGKFRFRNQ